MGGGAGEVLQMHTISCGVVATVPQDMEGGQRRPERRMAMASHRPRKPAME